MTQALDGLQRLCLGRILALGSDAQGGGCAQAEKGAWAPVHNKNKLEKQTAMRAGPDVSSSVKDGAKNAQEKVRALGRFPARRCRVLAPNVLDALHQNRNGLNSLGQKWHAGVGCD